MIRHVARRVKISLWRLVNGPEDHLVRSKYVCVQQALGCSVGIKRTVEEGQLWHVVLAEAIFLLTALFLGTNTIPTPYPISGPDPTAEEGLGSGNGSR